MLWQAVRNITHGGLPRITITPLSPSYPGTSTQPRTSSPAHLDSCRDSYQAQAPL